MWMCKRKISMVKLLDIFDYWIIHQCRSFIHFDRHHHRLHHRLLFFFIWFDIRHDFLEKLYPPIGDVVWLLPSCPPHCCPPLTYSYKKKSIPINGLSLKIFFPHFTLAIFFSNEKIETEKKTRCNSINNWKYFLLMKKTTLLIVQCC